MMKNLFLSLVLLLLFTACENKKDEDNLQATHDANIIAKAKAEVHAEYKIKKQQQIKTETRKKDTKLNQMGISMDKGTITIDTHKTKSFFNAFSEDMQAQIKNISNDLQKGILETKEAGISINKEHINIDLNKTKSLLDNWSRKINVFVKEFDDVAKSLDINTSKGK